MARREINGCRVLLTGASSGIGRALAIELARCGARQVIVARRLDRLEEVQAQIEAAGGDAAICQGDVTHATTCQMALERCESHYGGVDVLINNAGVGGLGRFDEANPDRLRQIMDVNFVAAADWIRAALPKLREGTTPLIVNMGSILGHRAIPFFSEYCASKFALRGFHEALRVELARDGIDMLLVSPGSTETDFYDSAIGGRKPLPWVRSGAVLPATVARATVKAMRKGRREIIPNTRGRLLVWANRFFPWAVDRVMAKYGR
ncbi:MAG: SDR family NAD(P)-dependent oxidoreductase [Pirellulales bacterium]|nr:SDR family NAD(P)-dependent oxidoreductase [Pirellulales bacterium]